MSARIGWWPRLVPLLFTFAVAGCASAPPRAAVERSIRDLESRRFAAMVAGDRAALETLLAPDLTYGHSNGVLDDRAALIAAIESGTLRYLSIEPSESAVRIVGATAVVAGRGRFTVSPGGGAPLVLDLRFADVWARRHGRWQLIAWQSTRVP